MLGTSCLHPTRRLAVAFCPDRLCLSVNDDATEGTHLLTPVAPPEQFIVLFGIPPTHTEMKTDAPAPVCATYFLIGKVDMGHPFSCFEGIRGHPFPETWELMGHPFSQNGHPFFQNTIFGGHQAQPVRSFKV